MSYLKGAILWIGKEFIKKIILGIIASLSITAFARHSLGGPQRCQHCGGLHASFAGQS